MKERHEKNARTLAALVIVVLGAIGLLYLSGRYFLPLLLPFLIAWGIAFAVRPLSHKLQSKLGISVRALRAVISMLLAIATLLALGFFVFKVVSEGLRLIGELSESEALTDALSRLFSPLSRLFPEEGGQLSGVVSDAVSSFFSSLLSGVGALLKRAVLAVPDALLFLLVTLIATLYFSFDLERINAAVLSHLPNRFGEGLVRFKDGFLRSTLGYLRSYLILMGITFVLVTLGLVLLRVEYALPLALLIALLDALPVLGVGTVLVPWSLLSFAMGDATRGVGLLVLFGVNTVLRQFLEPKIVGDTLGLPPIVSLVLLYISYRLFGLFGLLLLPLFSVLVVVFLKKGETAKVDERPVA